MILCYPLSYCTNQNLPNFSLEEQRNHLLKEYAERYNEIEMLKREQLSFIVGKNKKKSRRISEGENKSQFDSKPNLMSPTIVNLNNKKELVKMKNHFVFLTKKLNADLYKDLKELTKKQEKEKINLEMSGETIEMIDLPRKLLLKILTDTDPKRKLEEYNHQQRKMKIAGEVVNTVNAYKVLNNPSNIKKLHNALKFPKMQKPDDVYQSILDDKTSHHVQEEIKYSFENKRSKVNPFKKIVFRKVDDDKVGSEYINTMRFLESRRLQNERKRNIKKKEIALVKSIIREKVALEFNDIKELEKFEKENLKIVELPQLERVVIVEEKVPVIPKMPNVLKQVAKLSLLPVFKKHVDVVNRHEKLRNEKAEVALPKVNPAKVVKKNRTVIHKMIGDKGKVPITTSSGKVLMVSKKKAAELATRIEARAVKKATKLVPIVDTEGDFCHVPSNCKCGKALCLCSQRLEEKLDNDVAYTEMPRCEHGCFEAFCTRCNHMDGDKCVHGANVDLCNYCTDDCSQCDERPCICGNICPHGFARRKCEGCSPPYSKNQFCDHGGLSSQCKICMHVALCPHGLYEERCGECDPTLWCEHRRVKEECSECSQDEKSEWGSTNSNICWPHGEENCDICANRCILCHEVKCVCSYPKFVAPEVQSVLDEEIMCEDSEARDAFVDQFKKGMEEAAPDVASKPGFLDDCYEWYQFLIEQLQSVKEIAEKTKVGDFSMLEIVREAITLFILVFQLYRSRNNTDIALAITSFFLSRGINNKYSNVYAALTTLLHVNRVNHLWWSHNGTCGDPKMSSDKWAHNEHGEHVFVSPMTPGQYHIEVPCKDLNCGEPHVFKRTIVDTEGMSERLDEVSSLFNSIFSSYVVSAIKTLILSFLAARFFPKSLSRKLAFFVGSVKPMSFGEIFTGVISSLSSMFRIVEAWWSGKPISDFLFSEEPVAEFFSLSNELLYFKDKLYSGVHVEGQMCQIQFREKIGRLLEIGEDLHKRTSAYDPRRTAIKETMFKLKEADLEVAKVMAGRGRTPPYAIVLWGDPSIGKSHLLQWICHVWCSVKGYKYHDGMMYTRVKTSQYWEQYNPFSQLIIHYSEVGNESVQHTKMTINEILLEINTVIDGTPCPVDMAFEGKGKNMLMAQLVIIDTNNRTMHIDKQMYCPSAMYRRFLFLHANVKDEFREYMSTSLDKKKSLEKEGNLLDRYYFSASTYTSHGKQPVENVKFRNLDLYEATDALRAIFTRHIQVNEEVHGRLDFDFIYEGLKFNENATTMAIELPERADVVDSEAKFEEDVKNSIPKNQDWQKRKAYGLDTLDCMMEVFAVAIDWFVSNADRWYHESFLFHLFCMLIAFFVGKVSLTIVPWWLTCFLVSFTYRLYRNLPSFVAHMVYCKFLSLFHFQNRGVYVARSNLFARRLNGRNASPYYYKECLAITTVLGALILYNKQSKKKYVETEGQTSSFVQPSVVKDKIRTIEEKCNIIREAVPVKLTDGKLWNTVERSRMSVYNGDVEGFMKMISRNVFKIRAFATTGFTTTYLLGVCKSYVLLNKHIFDGEDKAMIRIYPTDEITEKGFVTVCVELKNAVELSPDVIMVDIYSKQFRDITKHFVLGKFLNVPGWFKGKNVRVSSLSGEIILRTNERLTHVKDFLCYSVPHKVGDCGLPVVIQPDKHGVCIAGIHCGGLKVDDTAYGIPLTSAQIMSAVGILNSKSPLLEIGSEGDFGIDFEVPHPKSVFRYVHTPQVDYKGKIPGKIIGAHKESKLERTPYHQEAFNFIEEEFNFTPVRKSKPMMGPKIINGEYVSPIVNAMVDMDAEPKPLNMYVLSYVINRYVSHVVTNLEKRGVKVLSPLIMDDAINGAPNDPYIRRVNASTSSGWGFSGLKSNYIPVVSEDPFKREPTDELARRILEILRFANTETPKPIVFNVQLKDEPRDIKKCLGGNTRLFYMSPIDHLIVQRMFLAPFFSLMVKHSDVFCAGLGLNMHVDADKVYKRLIKFSPKWMELDYRKFDIRGHIIIRRAVCTIIYMILCHFGYNDEAQELLRGVLSSRTFVYFCMLMDLFCKPGSQPSGEYATAEFNSVVGVVELMYSWYMNPKLATKDFFLFVKPVVYGDDVLAAVKEEVSEDFNNFTYAKDVAEYFDQECTSSAKDGTMTDFIEPEKATFLKRNFRWSEQWQRYVAPLDMNSIYKSMEWFLPSGVALPEEQSVSSLTSSLWELFFHVKDEAQFVRISNKFKEWVFQAYLIEPVFPTYIDIAESLGFRKKPWIIESEGRWQSNIDLTAWNTMEEYESALKGSQSAQLCMDCGCSSCELNSPADTRRSFYLTMRNNFRKDLEDIEIQLMEEKYDGTPTLLELQHNTQYNRYPLHVTKKVKRLLSKKSDLEATLARMDAIIARTHRIITEGSKEGLIDVNMEQHQNVLDVVGEDTKEFNVGETIKGLTVSHELLLDDFFSRPVIIDSFEVKVGDDISVEINPWNKYMLEPSVRAKLRNYAYFKGEPRIMIEVSGTPYHYGKCMASYQAHAESNKTIDAYDANLLIEPALRGLFLTYLSQAPGTCIIDYNGNKPVKMDIPFIHPQPFMRLYNNSPSVLSGATSFDDFETAGLLYLYSINPVSAATASPTAVFFQVYMWFENVVIGPPTATQIEILTEGRDERVTGPMERMATSMAAIANALTTVPNIAPLAMASSYVFKGIAGITSWFGWSRPPVIDDPKFVKNRPYANTSCTIGSDTVEKICFDPKQEVSIDPRVCGSDKDEMSIAYVASVQSYLTTFAWDETDTPFSTILWRCHVTPQLDNYMEVGLNTFVQPTASSFAVLPFRYWRGKNKFKLEVSASKFHRGKFGVMFEPNCTQGLLIAAGITLNKDYIKIIDLEETQDVEFCVEYAQPQMWLDREGSREATQFHGDNFAYDMYNASNGLIFVFPFTQLQSPDGSPVYINVYTSMAELQVQQMESTELPTWRYIVTEGDRGVSSEIDFTCLEMNTKSIHNDQASILCFGEQPLSFRACLKRYQNRRNTVTNLGATAYNVINNTVEIYPNPLPGYGGAAVTSVPIMWDYLRYAYLGMKGGIRKRFRQIVIGQPVSSQYPAFVDLGASIDVTAPDALNAISSTIGNIGVRGSATFIPSTNGGIEVEIPYYNPNLFIFSFSDTLDGVLNSGQMNVFFPRNVTFKSVANTVSTSAWFQEDMAVAEDFTMMRFNGAPYLTYVT